MEQETRPNETDSRIAFYISIGMGLTFAALTAAIVGWIFTVVYLADPIRAQAAIDAAQPYSGSNGLTAIISPTDTLQELQDLSLADEQDTRDVWIGQESWNEGVQAGQQYIADFPEPQNAVVLNDMTTSEIWAYMQQHVSGALGVSCQYCHDITNFSIDLPQKISARLMMTMVNDINARFITQLPNWRGYYVQCATCHYNEPINMPTVSERFDASTPPIDVELEPLNENGEPERDANSEYSLKHATIYYLYNYQIWKPFEADLDDPNPRIGRGSLAQVEINAEGDEVPRLQLQTTNNQNTMNLMAWSLREDGCTFCHNSRNFYAYEDESEIEFSQHNKFYGLNRLKAQQMLLMTTYLSQNWSRYVLPRTQPAVDVNQNLFVDYFYSALPTTENAKPVDRAAYVDRKYYIQVDQDEDKTFLMPGCYTCHRENSIPKAAIREEGREITEADIESMTFAEDDIVTFPRVLRGQQ